MAVTIDDFAKIWASTSPLTPYEFSESNYKNGWNFIGGTPPSRQMWDFLQKNNDEKMQYLANNYLPLSGGTITGGLTVEGTLTGDLTGNADTATNATNDGNGDPIDTTYLKLSGGTMTGAVICTGLSIKRSSTNGFMAFSGGTGWTDGSVLTLSGKDRSDGAAKGGFILSAHDGTNAKDFAGTPSGTLTWNGQPIQTSSDKRLKQDFSDVPAEVLEAWGKVEWKQFKYKEDVERKGDSCRFHTGLVAQDVKEVGEENNVDLLKYGILCHDVREATEEHEAVDLWTVRYEEALAMEVIYLRNEIKKLREEIKALRTE